MPEQTGLIKIIQEIEAEARKSAVNKSQRKSRISRKSSASNTVNIT